MKELKVIASLSDITNVHIDDKDLLIEELKRRLVETNKSAIQAIRLLRKAHKSTPVEIQVALTQLESSLSELPTNEVENYLKTQFTSDKIKELDDDEEFKKAILLFLNEKCESFNFDKPKHWTVL